MKALPFLLLLAISIQTFCQVKVRGYYRKDGTYVQPHYRSNPDGNPYNNWSYPGNVNPYTGKVATGNPDTYLDNYYNRNSSSRKYAVSKERAVVRSGPSASTAALTTLSYQDQVEVTSTSNDLWYQVRVRYYDNQTSTYRTDYGYVHKSFLTSTTSSAVDNYNPNNASSLSTYSTEELTTLYANLSREGANQYNNGNYQNAFEKFKQSLAVFDIFVARGRINSQVFDTTTTLYTGISAEKANRPDEAAVYYAKIADKKATGEGFVEIYKWLADYYRRKDDVANASKFAALGKQVYPYDPFWAGFNLDMLREKGSKEDLFGKYDQVIKENPDNYVYLYNYGVELYQAAYDPDPFKRPANSKELIAKAVELMKRTLYKNPNYTNAYMVLGQIYYNQGVEINNENKAIRPQNSFKLTAEELKKKEVLRAEVMKKFDLAIPYLVKVDELHYSYGNLAMEDKENLKNALDLLVIMYEEKANQLEQKKRQAEAKKSTAEVQQYDEAIRNVQYSITKYTDKYNRLNRHY